MTRKPLFDCPSCDTVLVVECREVTRCVICSRFCDLGGTLQGDALMALSLSKASAKADFGQDTVTSLSRVSPQLKQLVLLCLAILPHPSLGFFSRALGHITFLFPRTEKLKGQAS